VLWVARHPPDRVFAGHLELCVAGDLGGLDGDSPSACRRVMLARRKVCGPKPLQESII